MRILAVAENIFFLVLVAVVGLIRWIMSAAENAKNSQAQRRSQPPEPNAPVERAPAQTEEERVRRFMEALGVPTNAPPPKMPRRQFAPKSPREQRRRVRPIDPFPRPTAWQPPPVTAPEPVVVATPPPPPDAPPVEASLPKKLSPATFEVQVVDGRVETGGLVRQTAATTGSWSTRLRGTAGVRDAIILREIFGPPRSLQDGFAGPN